MDPALLPHLSEALGPGYMNLFNTPPPMTAGKTKKRKLKGGRKHRSRKSRKSRRSHRSRR